MKSISDLAQAVGHQLSHISWAIGAGLVPPPDLRPERRRYYSARQFARAVRAFSPVPLEEFFTATALCRQLQISTARWNAWNRRGLVPSPFARKGKRDVWSREQLEGIRKNLPILLATRGPRSIPAGYFSQTTAAKTLGVPKITFSWWLREEKIPRPARRAGDYRYPVYSEADLDKIRGIQAEYFAGRQD